MYVPSTDEPTILSSAGGDLLVLDSLSDGIQILEQEMTLQLHTGRMRLT
jgi:hypothetical protein